MRNLDIIKSKRAKLYEDLESLKLKWRELYYSKSPDETKEARSQRCKEMGAIKANEKLIEGQIEALTFVLNEDYVMSELNDNLEMVTIDWRENMIGGNL